jgi:hypothetical protein
LSDTFGKLGPNLGNIDILHRAPDDHSQVRLHHESEWRARAVVQVDGVGHELNTRLFYE